ncbi:FG-GAP repeat domain-containing protein [Gilvimarinus sp. F26214L]|uniref:FG-GAP repeat domain-containing protein n=1 Tax=Gilvimarinus sp. DZF01 TaxID=3461371 RepID=UPI0040451D55
MKKNALCALCLLLAPPLLAAPQYVASVIEPAQEIRSRAFGDLDGDGRQDLLLQVWSNQRGREILVYRQGEEGQYPGSPSQSIEIKRDIIAFALADLRDEPGEELLFFTRNGAYSFSSHKKSYAGNLKKLFDWELVNTVPETKSLGFLGRLRDYNGDGFVDLLLPGRERYALFRGDENGGFGQAQLFPKPYRDPRRDAQARPDVQVTADNGLSIVVETPSVFAGLFPDRSEEDEFSRRTLGRFGSRHYIMDLQRWLAAVHPARLNGDELQDFVFIDHSQEDEDAERRFNGVIQSAEGVKDEADWQQNLKGSGQVIVADFNGDQQDDILSVETRGNNQASLMFFANQGGAFDFKKPDQVMRFSGYEVEPTLQDLNGDGHPELIVSYYSLAAMDAIRSGSMVRTTLIYKGPGASGDGEGARLFDRRPDVKIEDKFSAQSVKGLTERPHFSADVDGDGRVEMTALDDDGALIASAISDDLQIADEPMWRFVPLHLIQSIFPQQLNADESTDLLLTHQNAVTVLVSRP